MRNRFRRLVALIALLGVAWATLWPAVSAAHARVAHWPIQICHGAGTIVDPAEVAAAVGDLPAAPNDHRPRTHCPLCLMAFYVAFHPTPEPPPFTFSSGFVTLAVHCAAMPFGLEVQLPESRAPPAFRA
ncbi:MAG TPA: DUF2946 family protein [Usitatibacter sp.]|nr:DUF2946 family protein [Usitatibacter sp.]